MGASECIDDLANLLSDGINDEVPAFAKTTYDCNNKLLSDHRNVERPELLAWFNSIEVACGEINNLVAFLKDNDLETKQQTEQNFDRASAAQDAATCADILYRRCLLIYENTIPNIAVGDFEEMSAKCISISEETRNQACKLVTDEFHVVFC